LDTWCIVDAPSNSPRPNSPSLLFMWFLARKLENLVGYSAFRGFWPLYN